MREERGSMRFIETGLDGVIIIEPDIFRDDRGFFLETFHQRKYEEGGIRRSFVQDNWSHSRRGTVRGLHYQLRNPQAKLIYVVKGEIFDVVVDIRKASPSFGMSFSTALSSEKCSQIFVPEGFAHGFCVLSEEAEVVYKCSDFYAPGDEYGILWCDPALGIKWPVTEPILSRKDKGYPLLKDVPEEMLPR
jgi:dTDP-4-dehydrorhamnose 3,5-epimerase